MAGNGDLYIGGGRVFLGGEPRRADLLVEGGVISRIGNFSPPKGVEVLDASGLLVLPGGIDNHVHFREPGMEEKEGYSTGTRGALHGGVTCVLEVQNNPPLLVDRASCRAKLSAVGTKAWTDFGFYGNLVPDSVDRLGEMAPYCAAFKLFAGGSTGMTAAGDYGSIRRLLGAAARAGVQVVAHCEDPGILAACPPAEELSPQEHGTKARPPVAEWVSVAALLELVRETGVDLHVFHLSTKRGVELVEAAREEGLPVSASTCPHYLYFEAEDARELGNLLKVNPGIHGPGDRDALRKALASGAIQAWSTDHAPHFKEEKERPYARAPSGIPSVDLFWPLLLELVNRGVLDLARAVDAAAAAPARIHGLSSKGSLELGKDGDLVLVELGLERRVEAGNLPSRAGYSPYEGRILRGWPVTTVLRGRVAFRLEPGGGTWFSDAPLGRPLSVRK